MVLGVVKAKEIVMTMRTAQALLSVEIIIASSKFMICSYEDLITFHEYNIKYLDLVGLVTTPFIASFCTLL